MKTLIFKKRKELQNFLLKNKSKTINFIPTMGNLHDGHLELISKAKENGNLNLISIYVNPLQFDQKDDFNNYPRTLEKDLKFLRKMGVEIIFLPEKNFCINDMSTINLGEISRKLCGNFRKGHFEGVAIIILKFLLLINPEWIFLGEKDFQQILVVKKIIKNFNLNVKVNSVETVRDTRGVALSSRNQLIKNYDCLIKINKCLKEVRKKILNGNFFLNNLEFYNKKLIESGIEKVFYLQILKDSDLSKPNLKPNSCRIFLSCKIEGVSFIDNLKLPGEIIVEKNGLVVSNS